MVATGQAALAALATTSYAVLLTDYDLPDMTGAMLLRQVLLLVQPPPTLILMSGHAAASLHAALADLPVAAILTKPFDLLTLYSLLDMHGMRNLDS